MYTTYDIRYTIYEIRYTIYCIPYSMYHILYTIYHMIYAIYYDTCYILPLIEAYTRRSGLADTVKSIFQTDGLLVPPLLGALGAHPHYVLSGYDGNVSCQDAHWLGAAFVCWPQFKRVWWPPSWPSAVRDSVPLRLPCAQRLWDLAAKGAEPLPWRLTGDPDDANTRETPLPAPGLGALIREGAASKLGLEPDSG